MVEYLRVLVIPDPGAPPHLLTLRGDLVPGQAAVLLTSFPGLADVNNFIHFILIGRKLCDIYFLFF